MGTLQVNGIIKATGSIVSDSKFSMTKTAATKSTAVDQDLVVNYNLPSGTSLTDSNAPGIGMHVGNTCWGQMIFNNGFKFYNGADFSSLTNVYASSFVGNLSGNATSASSAPWSGITGKPSTFAPSAHTHNQLVSRGNVTAESGTNWPAVSGISMSNVYNNGYPTTYGNVLTLYGAGCGQLLLGWSSTSGANAPAYIRSKRDTTDANWSSWQQLATTDGSVNYANSSGYASSAGAVAWSGVSGKPSTFTPSSHSHNTLTFGSEGATASVRSADYTSTILTGGWANSSAGYSSTYGTTLDISGYSTQYHRLAFNTTGTIEYWHGINTKTLSKVGNLCFTGHTHSSYLPLSGGTLTGALNLANGTWNSAGDDCYFGDNNTAGSFAIKGINGTTNLKMVQYGGTAYGTISFDGSVFTFSNVIQLNTSNWTSAPNVGNAPLQFSPGSIDAITSSTYYKPWFGGSHGISGSGYYNTIVCGVYHTNDPSRAGFYIGASLDHNNADTFYHFARDGHFITPRLVTNNYGSSFPGTPYTGEVFFKI